MDAIRVEGLKKAYGPVAALDGLDLRVAPGEVYGFLGPNGAGKTTTIRILTGLARADGGRAWVAGAAWGQAAAHRIGHLPEEPAFYPWMTPLEFLDHLGRLFGLDARARAARAGELLDRVGLSQAARRRIGGFSRGMRQRLGLAQALLNRPEVLFLDEPASALDPAGRRDVLALIGGLRGRCAVFMSTHILADVERVCDTVGIIARGRLAAQAPRRALLAEYAAPVFELEADPGQEAALARWAEGVRRAPWAQSVALDGVCARVVVREVAAAKRALPRSAVEADLLLRRYEIVQPSLEDVFLRLVGEEVAA